MTTRRISILVEYDGTDFFGWQIQDAVPTVQGCLESAVSDMLVVRRNRDGGSPHRAGGDESTRRRRIVQGASRTDRGVHANGQVAHFDDSKGIDVMGWVAGLTSKTPAAMTVVHAAVVPDDFNARFDSLGKTYRYTILSRHTPPARGRYVHHVSYPLDIDRMQAAAGHLVGEHDFAGFATKLAALPDDASTRRRLTAVTVSKQPLSGGWPERSGHGRALPGVVTIEVTGNAFLYNMVRNIAGALLEIGRLKQEPDWILDCLNSPVRQLDLPTAPARGLTLEWVHYPDHPHGAYRPADIPVIRSKN